MKTPATYPVKEAAFGVVSLAAANWYFDPSKVSIWALALAMSAGILSISYLPACRKKEGTQNTTISRAQFMAFLILGISLAISLFRDFGAMDAVTAKRSFGVVMGFVLIVTGNHLPKTFRPLNAADCNSARLMAAERFAGRVFVLAGIIYTGIWIFWPDPQVNLASSLVGLAAFALVMIRWLILRLNTPSPNQNL